MLLREGFRTLKTPAFEQLFIPRAALLIHAVRWISCQLRRLYLFGGSIFKPWVKNKRFKRRTWINGRDRKIKCARSINCIIRDVHIFDQLKLGSFDLVHSLDLHFQIEKPIGALRGKYFKRTLTKYGLIRRPYFAPWTLSRALKYRRTFADVPRHRVAAQNFVTSM